MVRMSACRRHLSTACACLLLLLTAVNTVAVHCNADGDHSALEQRWHSLSAADDCASTCGHDADHVPDNHDDEHDDCVDNALLDEPLPQRQHQHWEQLPLVAICPQREAAALLPLVAIVELPRCPRPPPDRRDDLLEQAYTRLLI